MNLNRRTTPTSRKIQRVITLGETLLALSIGTAVVVGAYVFYAKGSADVRADQTADGMNQIITGIKDRYGALGSYTGVTNASIITNAIVPKTFPVSAGVISTPHGGNSAVTVAPADGGTTFTVILTGLPQSACPTVVARIDGTSSGIGAAATVTAAVPDLTSAAAAETVKAIGGALSGAKTITQCAAGTAGLVSVVVKSQ